MPAMAPYAHCYRILPHCHLFLHRTRHAARAHCCTHYTCLHAYPSCIPSLTGSWTRSYFIVVDIGRDAVGHGWPSHLPHLTCPTTVTDYPTRYERYGWIDAHCPMPLRPAATPAYNTPAATYLHPPTRTRGFRDLHHAGSSNTDYRFSSSTTYHCWAVVRFSRQTFWGVRVLR